MYVNGYIIQKFVDNGYKGVDGSGFSTDSGENWYLNRVEDTHPPYTLETGDFTVFKVYEMDIWPQDHDN